MKRFYILSIVAYFFAGSVLTGCSKDDEAPGNSSITFIDAKVENGTNYNSIFDKVKAIMYYGKDENEFVVAEGKYSNGGFMIQLPATVDPEYLSPIVDGGKIGDEEIIMEDWIEISDKTVKGGGISLQAYNQSGDYLGDFYYLNSSWDVSSNKTRTMITISVSEAGFVYCDKDVKITGSTELEEEVEDTQVKVKVKANAGLKKGWNIIYLTIDISIKKNGESLSSSGIASITTSKPGEMKWYFEDDMDDFFGINYQKSYVADGDIQLSQLSQISKNLQQVVSKYRLFPKSQYVHQSPLIINH